MKTLFHKSTILLFSLTLITSCGSDDNGTQVDVNTPPEGFNLLSVANGSTGIDRLPVLTWQASTDADGDEITYEVYMDTEDASTLVASNITSTFYQPGQRLQLLKEYQWRVVANDENGGATSSGSFSFTTRGLQAGQDITNNAAFGEVWYHSVEYFNGNFLVLGGGTGNTVRNEVVWLSTNGVNWTDVTNSTSFTPRFLHASVVFKNKLWVIGGFVDGVTFRKDIWSSIDGVNWVQETADGGLPELFNHEVVAYDDKLWIIGGHTTDPAIFEPNTDVWVSEDGVNWNVANTSMTPFEAEVYHDLVAFDDKLWVIGGNDITTNMDEMWWTTDGNTWTKAEPQPSIPLSASIQIAFVLDGRMWILMEGVSYYSTDGIGWVTNIVPAETGFPISVSTTFTIHNGAAWFPTADSNTNSGRVWIKE